MRCLACGAEMQLLSVAGGDPEGQPILVSGFERRTHKCLDCGVIEQRLVFRSQGDTGAAEDRSLDQFSEPADSGEQDDTAFPAQPIYNDSGQQEDVAHPPAPFSIASADNAERGDTTAEQLSVAPADSGQQEGAARPTEPFSVSPADRGDQEHNAKPNAWAQSLERIQQRIAALAKEAARERAAKAAQRAPKNAISNSPGEADRLADKIAVSSPLAREITSLSKSVIATSPERSKEFDLPWDSLDVPVPTLLAPKSSTSQPDALAPTLSPDLVSSVPARSQRADEHPEQALSLPKALRDNAAGSAPSELQSHRESEKSRAVWVRAMTRLIPTPIIRAVQTAILQTNTDAPKE